MALEHLEKSCLLWVNEAQSADKAHEVSHIRRVVKTAKKLAKDENADIEVVVAAAYLHDIVSLSKDHPKRHLASQYAADEAVRLLSTNPDFDKTKLDAVHHAIIAHSYSANRDALTIEAQIVQDADRLDALGAIGIARCIQVGTALDRNLYCETDPFCDSRKPDDLAFTLDHFYTKLLHINKSMYTDSAKRVAKSRLRFMQGFLAQLETEII